jgi:putative ABC transport system permease protein
MGVIRRSIRNLIRSPLRTTLMIALLAVSIGLALIMFTVHGATANQLGSIGTQIGTEITIRPAGSYGGVGGMGGGEPLAQEDVDKLGDIDHVVSVQPTVQTQYTGDSLQSGIESGTLGPGGATGESPPTGFRMGIMVMGFDAGVSISDVTLLGDAQMTIVDGRYFTTDENDADVMVIGQDLADANDLEIGDTVDIEGTSVEVIGIYDSGQVFGNNMIVMPIDTVQNLFGIDGVTSVTVVADDVNNVGAVVSSIREIFPTSVADVTTAQDMYARINGSVAGARSSSTIGMIVAFVVAGVVVLFSVVLLIRQRVKEIGILKAIGASNRRIGLQFSLETLAVCVVGAIIGALVTYPLAQKVGNLLTGSSTSPSGGLFLARGGGMFSSVGGTIGGIHVAVSPEVFLYALGIAAALAIVASVLPAWYIARVRPAEVLRNE